jgi:fructose-1,6-bisphosphatase I
MLTEMLQNGWTSLRQNNIMNAALRSSGKVAAIASEEEDEAIWLGEGPFVVVFDPLDGSRNIDSSIPTGTIFGIYRRLPEADHLPLPEKAAINVLQRGERIVAAGYALYSSATVMCLSVGSGLYGFTLDHSIGEFVYSHHDIRIPERGYFLSSLFVHSLELYSLNLDKLVCGLVPA